MLETRRLLKESKNKRIIIDDSDKMIIEPYDSEPLSIYCEDGVHFKNTYREREYF